MKIYLPPLAITWIYNLIKFLGYVILLVDNEKCIVTTIKSVWDLAKIEINKNKNVNNVYIGNYVLIL